MRSSLLLLLVFLVLVAPLAVTGTWSCSVTYFENAALSGSTVHAYRSYEDKQVRVSCTDRANKLWLGWRMMYGTTEICRVSSWNSMCSVNLAAKFSAQGTYQVQVMALWNNAPDSEVLQSMTWKLYDGGWGRDEWRTQINSYRASLGVAALSYSASLNSQLDTSLGYCPPRWVEGRGQTTSEGIQKAQEVFQSWKSNSNTNYMLGWNAMRIVACKQEYRWCGSTLTQRAACYYAAS